MGETKHKQTKFKKIFKKNYKKEEGEIDRRIKRLIAHIISQIEYLTFSKYTSNWNFSNWSLLENKKK